MATRQGDTLCFGAVAPVIEAYAAVGGKKEGEGPLAGGFDELEQDNTFGQKTWEAAERELAVRAARHCLQKAQAGPESVDLALAGDLQAQCTASGYAMRELGIPFAGLYGACSTMAEALALGAALCGGGCADRILTMACSHFCASERQFRTPLSYGAVRTPTSQWTATAAGCCLVRPAGYAALGAANGAGRANIAIKAATFGRVQDLQIKDINNMGAAMAPAAAATLTRYLRDTHTSPQDFDTIYTGDLGRVGSELLAQLLADEGIALPNHEDCGKLLYNAETQNTHSGGSGAGCCAGVLCSHILPALAARKKRRVLFIATGALMSQTTFLQKESIPTVAHLVELAAE
jgi:stage V sporulation protein AD